MPLNCILKNGWIFVVWLSSQFFLINAVCGLFLLIYLLGFVFHIRVGRYLRSLAQSLLGIFLYFSVEFGKFVS